LCLTGISQFLLLVQTAFTVPLFFFIVEYFVIVSSLFFSFISGPGPKIILRTEQKLSIGIFKIQSFPFIKNYFLKLKKVV